MESEEMARDLRALVAKAMEHPGVAFIMKVYGEYQQLVAATHEFFSATNTRFSFSTTDSSSQ